jgi:photosystem II stability/assembly factor-like uncharacterized protein
MYQTSFSILLAVAALLPNTSVHAQGESPISFEELQTGVTASFRGLAMRGPNEVWVTGSQDTVIKSEDAGKTWQRVKVPHAMVKDKDGKPVTFDYRDVELLPNGSVIVMSIGNGEASNLFRSTDNGASWQVVLRNKEPEGFFDGIVFDKTGQNGLLFGDPLRGRLDLYRTADSGKTWEPVDESKRPKLTEGEYGFAASGSGAAMVGSNIWIATGGSVARLHRSSDSGQTWSVANVPMRSGNPSSGVFSIAVTDKQHIVAVGGDYLKPDESVQNVAASPDGGKTWLKLSSVNMPHKACVKWLGDGRFLTCGRTGVALSSDGGRNWSTLSKDSWYVCSFDAKSQSGFLAGKDGRLARFKITH